MIIEKNLENLELFPEVKISFGIKKIVKNPLVTIILIRKEIKKGYEIIYSLEKEIFKLPKEKAKLLKPAKKGLLTRTGKRIDRLERKILEEITKNHKLKISARHDSVILTLTGAEIGQKQADISKDHAEKFFKFI